MPFEPTHTGPKHPIPYHPTCCWLCGSHAVGMGFGEQKFGKGDLKFLCSECIPVMANLKKIHRIDIFELKALDGGVEAVGDYLDTIGLSDLGDMDELQARMIVKAAVQGYAKRLRILVSDTGTEDESE